MAQRAPRAGETVIITPGGTGTKPSLGKVERLTKTQIVLTSGSKFNIITRRSVGGSSWSTRRLVTSDEPEFAHLARTVRDNQARAKVQRVLAAAGEDMLNPEALETAAQELRAHAEQLRAWQQQDEEARR